VFDFWQRLKHKRNIKQFVFKLQIYFKRFVLCFSQNIDYQNFTL